MRQPQITPAQALIVLRLLAMAPREQDRQRGDVDGPAGDEARAGDRFRAVAECRAEAGELEAEQRDGDQRQCALQRAPVWLGEVARHTECEEQQADVTGGYHKGLHNLLGEQQERALFEPRIGFEVGSGIEPDRVEEEAPGHRSGTGPDQPCGTENHQDGDDLVEEEDRLVLPSYPDGRGCHRHDAGGLRGCLDGQRNGAAGPDALRASHAADHRQQIDAGGR